MSPNKRKLAPDDHSWDLRKSKKGNLPADAEAFDLKLQEWSKRDWIPWLREHLSFPFEVERMEDEDDAYFTDVAKHEPFRLGHMMKVTDIFEEQVPFHGVIVKVKEGRRTDKVPLCDLEVTDKSDPNFWPVREYVVWDANKGYPSGFDHDPWEGDGDREALLALDKEVLVDALLELAAHNRKAEDAVERLVGYSWVEDPRLEGRPPRQQVRVVTLRVTLAGSDPEIWRRFKMPVTMSLDDLHDVIQIVMGWTDSHLHEFTIDGKRYGKILPEIEESYFEEPLNDEDEVLLYDVLTQSGQRFTYKYDFGDSWSHTLLVEEIQEGDGENLLPVCLAGASACPPEDCGGIGGYHEMLECLADPNDGERESYLEWLGDEWDLNHFDPDKVNAILARFDEYVSGWDTDD